MAGYGAGQSMVVGRGLVEILPDFRKWGAQLAADMRLARTQLDGTAAGLRASATTVGKSMGQIGKATSLVGLGVAAASVKMAGDFQAHTAVLQTAAGETSKGLKTVRAGILSISQNTGTGITNLTDGMYQIEKAGFRGSQGLEVLKAAAQGAREENAKLSDVTNAMTSVMASYHLKSSDSVRVMNAMKTAAGEGKITMEEFSGALSTVLPIASANHIAFEDVAGSMATLTQHGTSARESTHELAATIRALASPNLVASREMTRFGLSAVDVSKNLGKRGLSGTVNLLVETILKQMGPAGVRLQKIFEGTKQSSQDAQIMLKNMTGDQKRLAEEYLKGTMLSEDWNSSIKGMPVAAQPALRNFKVLVDRSRGFSRELKNGGPASQTFTDALKKMAGGAIGLNTILQITGESAEGNAERIKKVGESFHNSSKDVEGWHVTAGLLNTQLDRMKAMAQVLAIEIGTKLIPVVSSVVGFFADHRSILLSLVVVMGVFLTTTSAVYVAMKLYAMYTRLAAVATAAFNLAMSLGTKYALGTRIQLGLLWLQEKLVAMWTGIVTAAQWAWNVAMTANPIGLIIVGIGLLVAAIVLIATKTQWFQKLWGWIWGAIKAPVMAFVKWFKENWQLITFTILTGGIGLAVAMIVRHWDGVKHAFSATIDWVKHNWPLLLAILTGPIGWATYWIVKHWGMITDGAKDAYHGVVNWFVRMGKDIGSFFSKLPGEIGDFFVDLYQTVISFWMRANDAIGRFFIELPGKLLGWGESANKAMVKMGENLIMGLWHGAVSFFTKSVPDFFVTLWHGIVDYFKAVFGIKSPSTVMAALGVDLIRGLFVGMLRVAVTASTWLKDHIYTPTIQFFGNAANWLYTHGRNLLMGLLRGQLAVAQTLRTWLNIHVYRPTVDFFSSAASWLYARGRAVMQGQINGLYAVARTLGGWFSKYVKGPTIAAFNSAVNWLPASGRNVINGMVSGFWQQLKNAGSWAKRIKNSVVNAIEAVFGINSPARAMMPLGFHIMGGLMKGLLSGRAVLSKVVKQIFHSVTDVFKVLPELGGDLLGSLGLGNSKAVGSAQQFAQAALKAYGWGPSQWPALKALWMGESGWRWNALNKSSGAYGIPQSLPASKMASAGKDWRTNAATQIRWGLSYIKSRYGSPVSAYSAWLRRSPHWYDAGGIARGVGAIMKNTNQPERVLSPRQTAAFEKLVGVISRGGSVATAGGGTTIVVNDPHFHNHGVIGSKLEVENWLVTSLDTLRKKGRIK